MKFKNKLKNINYLMELKLLNRRILFKYISKFKEYKYLTK